MLNYIFFALLTIACGVSIVIQQALNTNLRMELHSAIWAAFVSYSVGLMFTTLVALSLRDPFPFFTTASRLPWWAWSGGFFGSLFIALAVILVPKLGAAAFIALLVTGQMLASVAFDHFGWLGLAQRSVDGPRLIGVALLIGGVILIRR